MAEAAKKASVHNVDFSNVRERGNFNPKHVPEGDYAAKIVKVEDGESKKDGSFQYIFTFKLKKYSQVSYPYYCKLEENQLWKLRNLLVAAGMNVPKSKLKLDPNKVVGKEVGVTMEDDEYEGKMKSIIASVFPISELADTDDEDSESSYDEDAEDDDSEEPDEEEAPAPKAKKKAAPVVEEDDEEEEDEVEDEEEADEGDQFDDMDRTALKNYIRGIDPEFIAKKAQSDDDLRVVARGMSASEDEEDDEEEEDEEPAPAPKKKASKKAAPKPADDDEEYDEIDISEL